MTNTYEVGFTPDDNNNIRLPGSVQPEPVRGDSAYGPGKWDMARPGQLDAKSTGGVVGTPIVNNGFGMEDSMAPSLNANVDVHNSDTSLMATASSENRSAQYKNNGVDAPEKGRNQYEDHS